jgi:rubrerythrin
MTEVTSGVSRGQFMKNAAKGTVALVGTSGVLAAVGTGTAFAGGSSLSSSDVGALQAAYTAESLAVYVYTAIIQNFSKFTHPKLQNIDYFHAALADEKAHKAALAGLLGSQTPKLTNASFQIPSSVLKTGQTLLNTGVALETAFVEAYLGAASTLSSADLRLTAAKIAANEATHFSFFDAAAGGHGVLPAVPSTATIPATVNKLKPFLTGK